MVPASCLTNSAAASGVAHVTSNRSANRSPFGPAAKVTLCARASGLKKDRVPLGNVSTLPNTDAGTDIQTGSESSAGALFHCFGLISTTARCCGDTARASTSFLRGENEMFRSKLLPGMGITRDEDADIYTALLGGLVNQPLANDPGGQRWRRLIPRVMNMYADDVGLP